MNPIPIAAACLLACALPAQNCKYNPDNRPGNGGSNVIPFGSTSKTDPNWSNQRYQQLIPTSILGNVPGRICELAWAPSGSRVRDFNTIQITIGQTAAGNLSPTFATNLGANSQVVFQATDFVWPTTVNSWNRIGLQRSFLYLPPRGNLVVEVLVTGAGSTGTTGSVGFRSITGMPRLYRYGWTGTPPASGTVSTSAGLRIEVCFDTHDLSTYGRGCKGTGGEPGLTFRGAAKLGGSFSIDLANGTSVAVLLLGLNGLPVPIDLGPAGAPGCRVYASPDLLFGIPTPNGQASVKIPVPPHSGFVAAKLWTQFLPLDAAANSLGLTASNFGRILMGN